MKKLLPLLTLILLLGNISLVKAQCYGVVHFDNAVGANGSNTFNITTSYCKELIMISYDGWSQPGAGPVTVDNNLATHIVTGFDNQNSGIAETYAYIANAPGTHTIVCTESPYSSPYWLNFAACFYATGTGNPLSIASLTSTVAFITCTTGGSITSTIPTTINNSMIYCNWENNNGQGGPFVDTWTGATPLGQLHEGNGIDASHAYDPAVTPGTYTFNVTNNASPNNGCGGLVLVLVDIPPPLCGGGGNLSVTTNQTNPTCGLCNGSINVTVNGGTSPFTYAWSPNVSTSASANNLCAGVYTISVIDANCHDTTVFDTLPQTVLPVTPRDTLTVNEKCFGDCNASSTIAAKGGTPPYFYAWAPSGGTNPTANSLCAGVYTVTVTDAAGCSGTTTATITQPAMLISGTTVNNVLCYGGTGTIAAVPTGGTSPYTYKWAAGNQTNDTATGLTIGTYSVEVTDVRGCTTTTEAIVTQPTALSVTISGPAIICKNDIGTLFAHPTGGTSPYKYTWVGQNINPPYNDTSATINPATQTDTVKVTDANGCTATGQITVTLGTPINVTITGPTSICQTLSTTLCSYAVGGTGGDTYLWSPGNFRTPCITVSPSATTVYSLIVTDNCGTTGSALYTLHINPLPITAFTSSVVEGCTPVCVQFYNTTTLAQGNSSTYLWTFGNGDSSKIQNPIYCYPNSGTYNVGLMVISDSGCSSMLNKTNMITAFQKPNGVFTYSPRPVTILSPTVQFSNLTTDAYNLIYWHWNFGDATDSVSTIANPVHTYKDTGTYCVNMIVEDEHGCMDTATNCLVIEPNFTLYIPSAFSPNGDRKNDLFNPKGEYVKTFEMYIFDRWGMQLYHTTNIGQGWDGSVNGGPIAQEDTYVYRIVVTDPENKQHTYVGNVTLIK